MPEDTRNFVPQPWTLIGEGQGWNNQHKTKGTDQCKIVCKSNTGDAVDLNVYDFHIDHEALAGAEIVVTNPEGKKNAWYSKRGDRYAVYAYPSSVTVDGQLFKTWAGAHGASAGAPSGASLPARGGSPFPPSSGPGRSAKLSNDEWWLMVAREAHDGLGIENIKTESSGFKAEILKCAIMANKTGEKDPAPPKSDGMGDTPVGGDDEIPF